MVANRSVGTGLTASAVISSWMWAYVFHFQFLRNMYKIKTNCLFLVRQLSGRPLKATSTALLVTEAFQIIRCNNKLIIYSSILVCCRMHHTNCTHDRARNPRQSQDTVRVVDVDPYLIHNCANAPSKKRPYGSRDREAEIRPCSSRCLHLSLPVNKYSLCHIHDPRRCWRHNGTDWDAHHCFDVPVATWRGCVHCHRWFESDISN